MTTEPIPINVPTDEQPESNKLTDVKAVIAYLIETFPNCFSLEGDAKPLKIGLFQDLAERLTEDEKVSKTQLRQALRRYTNSWRYLRSLKVGIKRVDLDGNEVADIEAEHIEHAQQALKESQAKVKASRAATKNETTDRPEPKKPDIAAKPKSAKLKRKSISSKIAAKPAATQKVTVDALKLQQKVAVQVGSVPANGVIIDLNKNDVSVRLDSGLTVKVKVDHIRV